MSALAVNARHHRENKGEGEAVGAVAIRDVRVELKHMGLLAGKTDKGSAHQSAKCRLFSGQRAGN